MAVLYDAPPPGPQSFAVKPARMALTIGALLFLLGTDVVIDSPADGGVSVHVAHHAMGDEALVKIIEAINGWLAKP